MRRSPPSPQPSPPEAWGEGVKRNTGWKPVPLYVIKSVPLFPLSPNGGEGQGEGEVISSQPEVPQRIFELLDDA